LSQFCDEKKYVPQLSEDDVSALQKIWSKKELSKVEKITKDGIVSIFDDVIEELTKKVEDLDKKVEELINENVKLCSSLPSQDIVCSIENNNGKKEDGTQELWKWTENEIEIAKKWNDSPLTRVRFLRARNWDVNLASTLLFDAISWRRTFKGKGVNNITTSDVVNEIKTGKAFFHGYDKQNRPITYVKASLHDGNTRELDEIEKFCVYMMEKEHNELFKNGVYRSCIIFDLNGFSLRNMDYQFMKFMIHILQNYYPDTLGVALVLNSPWLFSGCWAVLKRWIDPVSQKKK